MCGRTEAQLLDLEVPLEPSRDDTRAATRLALILEREADDLDERDAGAALRRVAAACLRTGDAQGESGSAMCVLGSTIAGRRAVLDDVFTEADPFEVRFVASALVSLAGDVESLDVVMVERRLREALATLTDSGPEPPVWRGWVDQRNVLVAAVGVSDPGLAALEELLARGEQLHSLRRGARRTRERLARAAGLLDEPPIWLSDDAVKAFEQTLDAASAGVIDPAQRVEALELLAWLGELADAARGLDELSERDFGRVDVRAARRAFDGLLIESAATPEFGRIETLAEGLTLLDLSRFDFDDRILVRQLRVAWRLLRLDALRSSRRLVAKLPRLFETERPKSDPAVISLLLDQRGTRRAMDDLLALNRVVADPERSFNRSPLVRPAFEGLGERLLALGQLMDKDEQAADDVLPEIERLARVAAGFDRSPGEALLTRAASGEDTPELDRARALLGDRAVGVLDEFRSVRARWLAAWGRADAQGELATLDRRLELLEDLGRLIESFAWASPDGLAQAWPGWELSEPGFNTLMTGFETELSRVVDRVLGGRGRSEVDLGTIIEERSPAVLLGVIERRLAELTDRRAGDDAPDEWAAVHEIGLGPPDAISAFGASARDEIAAVCRYAEELALPPGPRDRLQDRRNMEALIRLRAGLAIDDLLGAAGWR